MLKFDSFKVKPRASFQRIWMFPNGRGASVIDNGYGSSQGLFELALLSSDFKLDFTTELLPHGVQGWLMEADVEALLDLIFDLPPKGA